MIEKLDAAIKAVCPIHGVCAFPKNDKSKWRIDFKDEATAQQRDEAQAVVDAFDVVSAEEPPSADELETDCKSYFNGGSAKADLRKVIKAKFISDLAWRLGKAPGALTNAELLAERNRIAAIYKAL